MSALSHHLSHLFLVKKKKDFLKRILSLLENSK